MYPCVVPIEYILTYMIQSGNYILSPDFISAYRKIDLSEAETFWHMVHEPLETSVADIRKLIFDSRSYGKRNQQRYYVQGSIGEDVPRGGDHDGEGNEKTTREDEDDSEGDSSPPTEKEVTFELDKSPCTLQKSSLQERLFDLIKKSKEKSPRSFESSEPLYPIDSEDLLLLPVDQGKSGAVKDSPDEVFICPSTLDEMTFVVRQVRSMKRNNLKSPVELLPDRRMLSSSHAQHSSSSLSTPSKHQRENNYRMFCDPSSSEDEM